MENKHDGITLFVNSVAIFPALFISKRENAFSIYQAAHETL